MAICHPTIAVNIRTEKYDVLVMRPSKWGNPFHIGRDGTRDDVIEKFIKHLSSSPQLMAALPELQGKKLGCVCVPLPCHASVLAEFADMYIHLTEAPVTRNEIEDGAAVEDCDHGVRFDPDVARNMTSSQIRKTFPRLHGTCPKGCGFYGASYATWEHYVAGDW
jgi:Domain of unknown function (DUF4326)